jgi:hypothetical protein
MASGGGEEACASVPHPFCDFILRSGAMAMWQWACGRDATWQHVTSPSCVGVVVQRQGGHVPPRRFAIWQPHHVSSALGGEVCSGAHATVLLLHLTTCGSRAAASQLHITATPHGVARGVSAPTSRPHHHAPAQFPLQPSERRGDELEWGHTMRLRSQRGTVVRWQVV